MTPGERRRQVVVAGHRGQLDVIVAHLADDDPSVREAALGAMARAGAVTDEHLRAA